jgi:hypothetical protein
MRCNEFDSHIDEMLEGIAYLEADQHMRQCERCASHLRARSQVHQELRKLAAASPGGPSRETDRAVMDAYRRLQQSRNAAPVAKNIAAGTAAEPRVLTFPGYQRSRWSSRSLWSSAAAAALVFGVLGSSVHLWHNTPVVTAPAGLNAPVGLQGRSPVNSASISPEPSAAVRRFAGNAVRHAADHFAQRRQPEQLRKDLSESLVAVKAAPRTPLTLGAGQSYESLPVTEGVVSSSVIHLASTGQASSVAQSASSTWPGYSNLMYCDPVVCSGPMQVVHIKVPVGQVKPDVGQSTSNSYVNAEVVVGPDGVARAIRVAN